MQRRNQQQTLRPRLSVGAVGLAAMVFGLVMAIISPAVAGAEATAQSTAQSAEEVDQIRVIEVSGLIDPVMHDFLLRELDQAEADGVVGVVLQMSSAGSVLEPSDFIELASRLRDSSVEVAIWVGPSGSSALGGSAELLGVADLVGVAAGSRIGDTGRSRLPASDFPPAFGDAADRLSNTTIGSQEAIELGISAGPIESVSVLREFVNQIEGYSGPQTEADDDASIFTQTQFRQLPLTGQLFHSAASPEVAYLFFVGGLAVLIFELFTAGVGVAGIIGVFLLVFGTYGLNVLPTNAWAIALLLLSFVAMAVDIQTNIPRLYSAVGLALFVVGSWFLYDGVSMSWITLGFGIIGAILYIYTGMPSMVRTRFSTPTIGRKWMIGTVGAAVTDVDPTGLVKVENAEWRAVTNRATPVKSGDRVRVVGIDRLLLEIEPEDGGAKDYRERG